MPRCTKVAAKSLAFATGTILALTGAASAIPIGPGDGAVILSGVFAQDDDVALYDIEITGDTDVFARAVSLSSTGLGDVPSGGFDPILSLFDGSGGLVDYALLDYYALLSGALAPGSYVLAVTQYDNYAIGSLLDGFERDGQGNFTAAFGCSQGRFCDVLSKDRTGDYVVSFEVAPVPVPAALPLLLGGLASLRLLSRRRRDRAV